MLITNLFKTIVRDLWTLRLPNLLHRLESPPPVESESQAASSIEESGDGGDQKKLERVRKGFDSPKLVETVALCYMGLLLLRLPIGLTEFYRYGSGATWEIQLTIEDGSKKKTFSTFEQSEGFLLICKRSYLENIIRFWILQYDFTLLTETRSNCYR
jgi:hypothetical protein